MLLRCVNLKEIKLQSSIRVICIFFDLISVQLENLKENKDSKFDDHFTRRICYDPDIIFIKKVEGH